MGQTEAAERGIVDAILGLDNDAIFREPLNDLRRSVYPKYIALDLPLVEGPAFPALSPGCDIPQYAPYRAIRSQRHGEYESALQEWARRLRLTHDLTETGECLPWALEFGRALCSDRRVAVSSSPGVRGNMPPPGSWVRVDQPNPLLETRADWIRRIKPALIEHYSAVRKVQRARPYADSAKRNPGHYRWFVLAVCGGRKPQEILDLLTLPPDMGPDTIRKGIKSVCRALGLERK